MTTKKSKLWILFIVAPVVLVGGLVGGAFAYRAQAEDTSRHAAETFLGKLAPGQPVKDAYALTEKGRSRPDANDMVTFEEALIRTGLVGGIRGASCYDIQRESNLINTFTMTLHSVRCRWDGGGGVIMVADGEIVSMQVDGKAYEGFNS